MTNKSFTVDFDSINEILKLRNQLNSRLGQLRQSDPVSCSLVEQKRKILESCFNIMNTDISQVYSNISLDATKKYYVYAHLDTSKLIQAKVNPKTTFAATLGMKYFPFYIGKGTGNRCFDINRNETYRKIKQKLDKLNKSIEIIKIYDNLSEIDAYCFESKLIDIFGLKAHNGYLVNLDEGYSAVTRRKIYEKDFYLLNSINKIMTV